jgi:hypothetical protein
LLLRVGLIWLELASEVFIEDSLKPKEMPFVEYMKLTKKALTVQDASKKHFSHKLSQGKEQTDLQVRAICFLFVPSYALTSFCDLCCYNSLHGE